MPSEAAYIHMNAEREQAEGADCHKLTVTQAGQVIDGLFELERWGLRKLQLYHNGIRPSVNPIEIGYSAIALMCIS